METGAVNRNKIKQLLEHELHKMKKGDLCKAIKIPPASLHNYLNELTDPNTPTLQKICDYFRIPMTDLLTNQIYDSSPDSLLTSDEIEILNLYRQISDIKKAAIKEQLEFFVFQAKSSHQQQQGATQNDKRGAGNNT